MSETSSATTNLPVVATPWENSPDAAERRRADLLSVARPILQEARAFLAENRTAIELFDGAGALLWREGDVAEGAVRCPGMPVRDPADGRDLGRVVITAADGSLLGHRRALATADARRMELSLAHLDAERRTRLLSLAFSDTRRWMDNGVVIFDRSGTLLHANRHAARFLEDRDLPASLWKCSALRRLAAGSPGAQVPDWLQADWFEPVLEEGHSLGTLLTLPVAHRSQAPQNDALRGIVGRSPALIAAKTQAARLAALSMPVLLLGPTGTGKEVFAWAIHKASGARGPFLPINCGAVSRELLASELFGHAEGAFTGARKGGMAGKFEAADGGTLFLDEIGEMPLDLQAHLLRVLEDGIVYRLGENKPRKVTVRIIAATNRDLKAEAEAGRFRMDLYYRLSVAKLTLPALKERPEDIAPLTEHFLHQTSIKHGLTEKPLGAGVLAALEAHDWPGNIRELRNVVEGLLALSPGAVITLADLPSDIRPVALAGTSIRAATALSEIESEALREAIQAEHGNLTRAASRLGIAKSTLYEKMKRYGLKRDLAAVA
ncbi:MAG TPA: sigma-54 dependent transcriptional regulator [Magnetospirillaceae bacterium]|nr:sigma-54 dependent transcriptional regulator [Magnetospirillaceae bacterium]